MGQKEFRVDIEIYSEKDSDIYDPKGKADMQGHSNQQY